MNWMPIETAPRDGTRILMFRYGWAESMAVGYWDSTWSAFCPVGGSFFQGATHWMPLPEPPT